MTTIVEARFSTLLRFYASTNQSGVHSPARRLQLFSFSFQNTHTPQPVGTDSLSSTGSGSSRQAEAGLARRSESAAVRHRAGATVRAPPPPGAAGRAAPRPARLPWRRCRWTTSRPPSRPRSSRRSSVPASLVCPFSLGPRRCRWFDGCCALWQAKLSERNVVELREQAPGARAPGGRPAAQHERSGLPHPPTT